MPEEATYFVYILSSKTKVLYIGITNSLIRRVAEHRAGKGSYFTNRYKTDRLVYYESFQYVINAISRETELKGWLRSRKVKLIQSINPKWRDLFEDFGKPVAYKPPTSACDSSLRSEQGRRVSRPEKTPNGLQSCP